MAFQIALLALTWLVRFTTAFSLSVAKPGCRSHCGEAQIPYPFGIGPTCSHNSWFDVECTRNNSILLKSVRLGDASFLNSTVTRINTDDQTLAMQNVGTINCLETKSSLPPVKNHSYDLRGSPFLFSNKDNVLLVRGCGGAVVMVDENNTAVAGCAAVCVNETGKTEDCYGVSCCKTTAPSSLDYYGFEFLGLKKGEQDVPNCTTAVFVDVSVINNKLVGKDLREMEPRVTVLNWMVSDLPVKSPSYVNSTCEYKSPTVNNGGGYVCHCKAEFYQGNSYLPYGCQVVRNCTGCVQGCISLGNNTYGCPNKNSSSTSEISVILGLGISGGSIFLLVGTYWFYQLMKRKAGKTMKAKYFKRNGGLLLKQQMSSAGYDNESIRIFTADELDKATDGYNENGQGGQGTVYKGMLNDGKLAAIKKSKIADETQLDTFINEVVLSSRIIHRNIVRLLGCCLETQVPLLVYELVQNGTLSQYIHDPNEDFPITWEMRLHIATDTASALSYLHSSSLVPIFHRDIKSSNILLDSKYRAKLSDFGISKSVSIDQTHTTTRVMGTFGYVDPEYFRSNRFTDKSDVYSFGVVLVELLTGQKAIRSTLEEERGLVSWFLSYMESSDLDGILAARVRKESRKEEVMAVANLAKRCLNLDGKRRPAMKEVAAELETIRSNQQGLTERSSSFFVLSSCDDQSSFSGVDTFDVDVEDTEDQAFIPCVKHNTC